MYIIYMGMIVWSPNKVSGTKKVSQAQFNHANADYRSYEQENIDKTVQQIFFQKFLKF